MSIAPVQWIGAAGPTSGNVDVVSTPLVAARDLSYYEALVFLLVNDGANAITMLVEAGDVSGVWDAGQAYSLPVPAGTARSIEIPVNLHVYWRMSATAAVGVTAARWGARGVRRSLPGRSGGLY
jgi:hypothetical protein